MGLSSELISLFAKTTNDRPVEKKETIVYGTVVKDNGSTYVKIDGSELLTPVSATANTVNGERVTVMIKNHTAIVTGNISSPAARTDDVKDVVDSIEDSVNKITEFDISIGHKADVSELNAANARIDELSADNITIKQNLAAADAEIDTLVSDNVSIKQRLTVGEADIAKLKTESLTVDMADILYASIVDLEATNETVHNLEATYGEFAELTTERFNANNADIANLEAKKLSAEEAAVKYANIDLSNIGQAAMEYFYAQSGLIENVTVSDGTITGMLVGVTIKGDLIEANSIIADRLVILGEDGVYYKLNTNGETVESEQTEYNSLNGQIITAKSITAEKIAVDDLVAFDATIGGFNITEDSIFSEVKDSEGNTVRGIHMDVDGQVNFGDGKNYIKYYRDDEGNYHLAISADTIMYDINGDQHSLADLGVIGEYIKIRTYEGEPCIELGETDSEFKVYITNTKILFVDSSDALAYFSNQSLHIKKAVIEDELQQGEFVWKVRANGNLGIVWKGADV